MTKRGLWHLRSRLHQRSSLHFEGERTFKLCEHSAGEIFSARATQGKEHSRTRKLDIGGHEIEYELTQNVTQKPLKKEGGNSGRFKVVHKNAVRSPLFELMRAWIMGYCVAAIILGYLAFFVVLNVVFSVLWYIPENKCCGDPTMSFSDVLNFAMQTSTTLGYGGFDPVGVYSNILVILNFFASLTLHALFAGIIFLKFVTPTANFQFSEIITMCNVNGLPCLELRVGHADGDSNVIQNLTAKLNFMYTIHYVDELGAQRQFHSMQELDLLVNWRHELREVWTLRHVVDETSPLFGVLGVNGLQRDIKVFKVTIRGIQKVTSNIKEQLKYVNCLNTYFATIPTRIQSSMSEIAQTSHTRRPRKGRF